MFFTQSDDYKFRVITEYNVIYIYPPLDIAKHLHKEIRRLTLTRCRRRGVAPASLVRAASIWKRKKCFFSIFFLFAMQSSQCAVTRVGNLRLIDPRRYLVIRPNCDYIFWGHVGRIYRPQLPVNRFEESRKAIKYIWLKVLRVIVAAAAAGEKREISCFAKSLRRFNGSDRSCVSATHARESMHVRCGCIRHVRSRFSIYGFEITMRYSWTFSKVADADEFLAAALKF